MPVTMPGGASHGLAHLSHAEFQAAQKALAKLKDAGSGLRLNLSGTAESATVSSGLTRSDASTTGLGTPTLIHGQGSDTFIGGVRSTSPGVGAGIGTDTVVSGSAQTLGGHTSVAQTLADRGAQHFSLSSDTINVAGATAASVKAVHPQEQTDAHTITLPDKTTITIAGLSRHDISKLHH